MQNYIPIVFIFANIDRVLKTQTTLIFKGKTVVCSDLEDVKSTAEPLHTKYKVNNLITYQDIDATNIPYENPFGRFSKFDDLILNNITPNKWQYIGYRITEK